MKYNRVNILGVEFDHVTMKEATKRIIYFLESGKGNQLLFTPNPEIVMEAYYDHELRAMLNQGSLIVPDGIGVVIASRLLGRPLKERVAGYDLMQHVFEEIKETKHTVFFFGAKPGVAKIAKEKMQQKYPGLQIVGEHHGYIKEGDDIVARINALKPDLLLVGLGAPRQERWIFKHLEELECKVIAGVGGSFDAMSGTVKRAPDVFIRFGLEWFYRLLTQPSRFVRMMRLPLFLWKVIFEGRNHQQ